MSLTDALPSPDAVRWRNVALSVLSLLAFGFGVAGTFECLDVALSGGYVREARCLKHVVLLLTGPALFLRAGPTIDAS